MSESTNTVAALTRNFLVDTDDLVDELLSAIKKCAWKDLKMQYQLGRLQASKDASATKEKYELLAEWAELEEEVQLRVAVAGPEESFPARQQECMDLMSAMFPDDIFRRVNEEN